MSTRKHLKASPSTWLILILVVAVIALSIFSVNSSKKVNKQEAEITKLEKKVEKLTPPKGADMFSYQKLFPDMKTQLPKKWKKEKKTVYLTFDDGPSKVTADILNTLKKEKVKATFFVVGAGTDHSLMKRITDEGHAIGVHTYSHKYKEIYESVDSYVKDYNKIYELIKKETGTAPTVYRYPGGSNNVYNILNQSATTAEMFRRGFVPFDWNVDSRDAEAVSVPAETIAKNALKGRDKDRPIILMHDASAKTTTAKALKYIIKGYKKAGYEFGALTNEDAPLMFSTPDGVRYD